MDTHGHFPSNSRLARRLNSRGRLLKLCNLLWIGLLLFAPPAAGARSAQGPLAARLSAEATWTFTCPPPGGWAKVPSVVCATVQDDDGLQEGSALYRYSVDGGYLERLVGRWPGA